VTIRGLDHKLKLRSESVADADEWIEVLSMWRDYYHEQQEQKGRDTRPARRSSAKAQAPSDPEVSEDQIPPGVKSPSRLSRALAAKHQRPPDSDEPAEAAPAVKSPTRLSYAPAARPTRSPASDDSEEQAPPVKSPNRFSIMGARSRKPPTSDDSD
jgi:hypothetical protein